MKRRYAIQLIKKSLKRFPAVLVVGARQVGKSTLVQQLVKEGIIDRYVSLDDLATLEAVRGDPDGFLAGITGSVALDEIQRAPDLLRALKKSIDERRKPGTYLLTGSANIFSYPGVTESLAGRMDIIHLEGLSVGEIDNIASPSSFIEEVFQAKTFEAFLDSQHSVLKRIKKMNKTRLNELVFYGGFPEVVLSQDLYFRERWFSAYQTAYIERDVRNIAKTVDHLAFSKVFRLAGLRTANLLNVSNLSTDATIDQRTVNKYLQLLENTFQVNLLRPWHTNHRKRFVKTPKIYLNDSGLGCYLAGIDTPQQLEGHPFCGALFETWVWAELRKLLSLTSGIQTTFYRTHLGREVDFVLEKGEKYCAIEVKWTDSVKQSDFAGLVDMQDVIPKNLRGIIFYTGDKIVPFSKNFAAVPLACLFEG